eukprot:4261316-Amphidinium_carterae.1
MDTREEKVTTADHCSTYADKSNEKKTTSIPRVMQPMWKTGMNNTAFIRAFTMWRDELFQHKDPMKTQLTKAVKVALLLNRLSGPVKNHLLLNMNVRDPDFDAAMQT